MKPKEVQIETHEKSIRTNSNLIKTIKSQSFSEKFLLLIATLLFSRFLIPLITNEMQKINRIRNEVISQAQVKLLEDATRNIITYEMLVLNVSYFKTSDIDNKAMQEKAFQRYSERVDDLFSGQEL